MNLFFALLTIFGLALFEIVSSIDNAVINAQVLTTMSQKAKKWFMFWGILIAVFLIRGLLPLLIVWAVNPDLGLVGAFTAGIKGDPRVLASIARSAPILLSGGGIFLLFLFFHWLFLEKKEYVFPGERFFQKQGIWFYIVTAGTLAVIAWLGLQRDPLMAISAIIGAVGFFITNGFKQSAESAEKGLMSLSKSDISKILYLEAIDATFSIDGVFGAFAFTLIVPLILLGNGLGAIVVRQLTVGNIERIKKYVYLKNGAMYSIFVLGLIMILDSFGAPIPEWFSPIITFIIVGYFFLKSRRIAQI